MRRASILRQALEAKRIDKTEDVCRFLTANLDFETEIEKRNWKEFEDSVSSLKSTQKSKENATSSGTLIRFPESQNVEDDRNGNAAVSTFCGKESVATDRRQDRLADKTVSAGN